MTERPLLYLLYVWMAPVARLSCAQRVDIPEPFIIIADRQSITADGKDLVTFTVKYGEKDLSESAHTVLSVKGADTEGNLNPGCNWFGTGKAGEYEFRAYNDSLGIYTDNSVTITVTEPAPVVKQYKRRSLGMQFISTRNVESMLFADITLSFMQSNGNMLVPVSVHPDPEDLFFVPEAARLADIFGINGSYPSFRLDYSSEDKPADASAFTELRSNYLKNKSSLSGISVRSDVDRIKGTISLSVSVRTGLEKPCRLLIFLMENNIAGSQLGYSGMYMHQFVLRSCVTDPAGDEINSGHPLKNNTTYSFNCNVPLNAAWNTKNMSIAVSVLSADSEGGACSCSNSVLVPLGTYVDFEYL